MKRPLVMAFVAHSGSGKTTLVEALIALATGRGLRVGALKHDAHRFEIDRPGKDSHRFAAAGAETTVIAAADKLAVVRRHDQCPPVDELVARYAGDLDLVLVEGWKTSNLPRIEVHRPSLGRPLLSRGHPRLKAVAADSPLDEAAGVPVLDLNDPEAVLEFILEQGATT